MIFEFDPEKSLANQLKHGIDFSEGQLLWENICIELDSPFLGELRKLVIGKINDNFWTAIITHRNDKVRIISIRRSRTNEKNLYEKFLE